MENEIAQRLRLIIESLGMNTNSFSKKIGKSYSNVTYILEGKVKPGFDFISTILKFYPHINSGWLITGEGEMFTSINSELRADGYLQEHLRNLEKQFAEIREMFNSELAVKNQQIAAKDRQIEKLIDSMGKPLDVVVETQTVPLWSEIQARA